MSQQHKETRSETTGIERRYFQANTRASKDDDKMRIGGLGAVFDRLAPIGSWFLERIEPGFFDGCDIDEAACLFNHDQNLVLARKKSGTLQLNVTSQGLDYTADLPSSRADIFELIERGDVYQSSFAFTVKKARWEEVSPDELKGKIPEDVIQQLTYGGVVDIRVLEKCQKLYDVSPVTYPAYKDATVGKRSLSELEDIRAQREQKQETKTTIRANYRLPLYKARARQIEQKQKQLKND